MIFLGCCWANVDGKKVNAVHDKPEVLTFNINFFMDPAFGASWRLFLRRTVVLYELYWAGLLLRLSAPH